MNNGIYNIDYVKQRAAMAGKLSRVDIFQGFVNPSNKTQQVIKVQEIRPLEDRTFGNAFKFFEDTTFGDFTAVFFPSREIIYFSNKPELMNGTANNTQYASIPTPEMVQAQVQQILETERLKARLAELEAEQEENTMWGQRMGTALEMLITRFVGAPAKTQMEAEPALNGTDVDTSNMSDTEKALVVLVQNFGEEWLQKFAAKIQNEPHMVPMIKSYLS